MADLVGSSGTLVTTTFETLGYHYQAYILDKLSSPLTESAAALVYVVGAIVVMVGYIMTGKVKDYLWFILGPALYLAVIVSRTETPGTEWKFGNDPRDQERVTAQVTALITKQQTGFGSEARVSTVFAEYNRVVSRIIQEIVETLDKNRKKTDLRFLLRAELSGFIHAQDIDDAGLRDLLHHGLFRSCANVLEAGKESQDTHNAPNDRDVYREQYENLKNNSTIGLGANAINFIAALRTDYPSLYNLSMQEANAGEQVLAEINSAERSDKDSETWRRDYEQNRRELESNNSFSCQQIWNFSYTGLIQHAKRVVDGSAQTAEKNGIDPQKFISDVAQAIGVKKNDATASSVAGAQILYRYVGQTLLRNTWDTTSTSAFINDYVNRDRIATLRRPAESELSQAERTRVGNREWAERSKLMMAAATMPYYQGLGLYLLSISFPFFFLLLLIPGKHAGCLLWFMMWIWIKSWDIGYAVVMMLDDVLFSIFSLGSASVAGSSLNPEFSVAMYSLRSMDPTFHLSTYYAIIATAMGAVPAISAQLILGSLKGGAGLIAQGQQQLSDFFTTGAREMEGQYAVTGDRLGNLQAEQNKAEEAYKDANSTGNPGFRQPLSNPLGFDQTGIGFNQEASRAWSDNQTQSPLYGSPDGTAGGYADQSAGYRTYGTALKTAMDVESFGDEPGKGLSWFGGMGKMAGDVLESVGTERFNFREKELKGTAFDQMRWSFQNNLDPYGDIGDGGQNAAISQRWHGGMEIPTTAPGVHDTEKDIESSRLTTQKNMVNSFAGGIQSFFGQVAGLPEAFPNTRFTMIPGSRGSGTSATPSAGGSGGGIGTAITMGAGAVLAAGAYGLGLIGPGEAVAGDIPPDVDQQMRARAAGGGGNGAEIPVSDASTPASEKAKSGKGAKSGGADNGASADEGSGLIETITAPIAALLGKDDQGEEAEQGPPALGRPRGSSGAEVGYGNFDGQQVAQIGAPQVTTNGVKEDADTPANNGDGNLMGYEGMYQSRVSSDPSAASGGASESYFGTAANFTPVSSSTQDTGSAITPSAVDSKTTEASFGFGVTSDSTAKGQDQGSGWDGIAEDSSGMASSWDTSSKRSAASTPRTRTTGSKGRMKVVVHKPEEPQSAPVEETVKKEEEESGAQIAFDTGMDSRGQKRVGPLSDTTILVPEHAQSLYNELRSDPAFYAGSKKELQSLIQTGGLNTNTREYNQGDIDFVSEMYAKANPDAEKLSLGRDSNPDRVILTGDRSMAEAWAKSGPDAVNIILEEIPKLQTSDALDSGEKSKLSAIETKYTDQQSSRSPLVVQVQGSVLDRLHPAQSSTTGVDYLRDLIEKHEGPITKAEFIDTYIKGADIAVTSAQPFEIRFA